MKIQAGMKNRTFVICIAVILALFVPLFFWGGHGRKEKESLASAATLSQPFEAKAEIRLKDLRMNADINQTAPGQATVRITQPETLAGMAFAYDGEEVQVSYKGLTIRLDDDSRLVSSVAGMIVRSIDAACSESGVNVELEGERLIVSGESDAGRFRIALDKDTGSIASLNLPEADLECRFAPMR